MNPQHKISTTTKRTWHLPVLALLAVTVVGANAAKADTVGLSKTYRSCNAKASRAVSSYDAVRCMDQEHTRLQQRVQTALAHKLGQTSSPDQKELIQKSQSFWQQHLDAECQSLRGPDSGNASDVVTECLMLKTARRVMELENGER